MPGTRSKRNLASSEVRVPEFIREIARAWDPIDQGRVGGVFALLADDDWRRENRVDWVLSQPQKNELGLFDNETVWAIAHAGITVAFIEAIGGEVAVVYLNRRSAMHPGWL